MTMRNPRTECGFIAGKVIYDGFLMAMIDYRRVWHHTLAFFCTMDRLGPRVYSKPCYQMFMNMGLHVTPAPVTIPEKEGAFVWICMEKPGPWTWIWFEIVESVYRLFSGRPLRFLLVSIDAQKLMVYHHFLHRIFGKYTHFSDTPKHYINGSVCIPFSLIEYPMYKLYHCIPIAYPVTPW